MVMPVSPSDLGRKFGQWVAEKIFNSPAAKKPEAYQKQPVDEYIHTGKHAADACIEQMAKVAGNVGSEISRSLPVDALIQNQPNARSAGKYNAVIDQFSVDSNPRYTRDSNGTYCNIFVWDVTRAMGAEIPHWKDGEGNFVEVDPEKSYAELVNEGYTEVKAEENIRWLEEQGEKNGWSQVSAEEAQEMANQGKPVVATWKNPDPNKDDHVGIVRPGQIDGTKGPALAQAGATNFNKGHIKDGFSSGYTNGTVTYWVHD